MTDHTESLTLKWGSVKGWDNLSATSVAILQRFFADGVPLSAMSDHPDEARREILCELIDQLDGEIVNEWEGKVMTKDEAKAYVRDYAKAREHDGPHGTGVHSRRDDGRV